MIIQEGFGIDLFKITIGSCCATLFQNTHKDSLNQNFTYP